MVLNLLPFGANFFTDKIYSLEVPLYIQEYFSYTFEMNVGSHVAVRNHEDFFLNFLQWYHLEIIWVSYREPQ